MTLGGAALLTTHSIAAVTSFLGTYVFGWGEGKAEERKAQNNKQANK
jgi:hypothetical protein